jgi:hypothetical protein
MKGEVHFWPFNYCSSWFLAMKPETFDHQTTDKFGRLVGFKGGFVFKKNKIKTGLF